MPASISDKYMTETDLSLRSAICFLIWASFNNSEAVDWARLNSAYNIHSEDIITQAVMTICLQCSMPSVLWRCWLGGRKGIRPVKNWVVGCWHGNVSGSRCSFAYGPGPLMPLPLIISNSSKSRLFLPSWFYHSGAGSHTHITILQPSWILSETTWVSRQQKSKTRKVKPIWMYCSKRQWLAVTSAGPYANLHTHYKC